MKNILKNKRGVFFTILSIFIAGLIINIFSFETQYPLDADVELVEERVMFLSDLNTDLESSYLVSALSVSSYHTIRDILSYMEDRGSLMTEEELEDYFTNMVKQGEYSGAGSLSNGIDNWFKIIADELNETFKVELTYEYRGNIILTQEEPYSIHVAMPLRYTIKDDFAKLEKNVYIETDVSIIGLKDPYIKLVLNGVNDQYIKREYNLILLTNTTLEDFTSHYDNGTYIYNGQAPSYLMRLTDDISNSTCCGIASLLKPDNVGIHTDKSYVDYKFNYTSNLSLSKIQGLPDDFLLDDVDVLRYNIGNFTR